MNIALVRVYGGAGHGKGLVDSMSAFGVKNILRGAIYGEDEWWDNSLQMTEYLSKVNGNKNEYVYRHIPDIDLVHHHLKNSEFM